MYGILRKMINNVIIMLLPMPFISNYWTFGLVACVYFTIFVLVLTGLLWLVTPGMKSLIHRIRHYL